MAATTTKKGSKLNFAKEINATVLNQEKPIATFR